jgi:hypothetical protein
MNNLERALIRPLVPHLDWYVSPPVLPCLRPPWSEARGVVQMVLMPGYNVEWFRQGDNPPAGPMALSPASETKRGASIFFLVLSMASPSGSDTQLCCVQGQVWARSQQKIGG